MKLHYLEIVSHDVEAVCNTYEATHSVSFSEHDELLGGARTCALPDGTTVGVRAPMRDDEDPVIRPYWLVDDLAIAIDTVAAEGAEIAMPATEIPGKGKFAIYIQGANNHGLWEV